MAGSAKSRFGRWVTILERDELLINGAPDSLEENCEACGKGNQFSEVEFKEA